VGLSQDEVERMRSLAKRVDMQVVLEILEGSWLDKQRDYHALVVSACASSGPVIALGPELQVPVVLITSRSSLQSLSTLPAGAFDFLIAPWDAEEIFLRVNRLVAGPRAPLGSPDHSSQRRPRVLVVDDDPSMTALISNALRRLPIYCDTARSGQEALSSVRQSPPDAMVLDVNLLDLNGFEVLKRVRQSSATKDLPVLLLTGRCQESDIAQGFGCGADDYVMKPFKPFDLANRVEQMIAARGRSDARPAR
jgi:DNA-binding response OmpR family regulator